MPAPTYRRTPAVVPPQAGDYAFLFANNNRDAFKRVEARPLPEALDTPKVKAPKTIFPIFFSVVTDGGLPGESNLLHVSAQFEPTVKKSWNILPQKAIRADAPRLTPEVLAKITPGAVPIGVAMAEMTAWLEKFKGQVVAVTGAVAFWHLVYHTSRGGKKPPFALNCVDVASFVAGAHGNLRKRTLLKEKDPELALATRVESVKRAVERVGNFTW